MAPATAGSRSFWIATDQQRLASQSCGTRTPYRRSAGSPTGSCWPSAAEFPDNLPAIWSAHWGYLATEQHAPVVLGEFGGRSVGDDADGVWQRALMDYAQQNGVGWLNWSFNPDSGDTGGLLSDDWLSVVQETADLYRGHLGAPLDGGASGVLGVAQGHLTVRGRSSSTT